MHNEYQVDDKFKLTVDNQNHWRIMEWTEESLITSGKFMGQTVEARWNTLDKFWPHMAQPLRYIQKRMIASGDDSGKIGELEDVIKDYEKLVARAEESLRCTK